MQMPLTEEDEVFVEKCFQRSLLVSARPHLTRIKAAGAHRPLLLPGTSQADLIQRHADRGLAPDRRNLSRGTRVLHVD